MPNLVAIRNPQAERLGACVEVSASRCRRAGIAAAYAGLRGAVIAVANGNTEVLVQLDEESLARHRSIESTAFSVSFQDLEEEQWFCSGVLEVMGQTKERVDAVCQHKNLKIVERKVFEIHYEFNDGEPPQDWEGQEFDPVLSGFEVRCWDCDFEQFYGVKAKRPKWVQEAWDALNRLREPYYSEDEKRRCGYKDAF